MSSREDAPEVRDGAAEQRVHRSPSVAKYTTDRAYRWSNPRSYESDDEVEVSPFPAMASSWASQWMAFRRAASSSCSPEDGEFDCNIFSKECANRVHDGRVFSSAPCSIFSRSLRIMARDVSSVPHESFSVSAVAVCESSAHENMSSDKYRW